MLFLNFCDNVLSSYTLRLRISRIINVRLFSKIFLKSLGLLSTVLTASNIALMRSIFYSKKSWMNTHQKKSGDDKTVADEFNRFFTSVGHADKINSLILSM